MTLTQAVFNTDLLRGFISGFGEGVNDLYCQLKDMKLTGWVDVDTHYVHKSIHVDIADAPYNAGDVFIPQLDKVNAFLKACKESATTLRHVGGQLKLQNGNDEYSTPTYTDIMSNASVARARVAISGFEKSGYKKLGRADIQCHGTLTMSDLHGIEAMAKATSKDAPVRINVDDKEMVVTVGSIRGARMSRRIDVDCEQSVKVETVFSSVLPKLLRVMGSGDVEFFIGMGSALILKHQDVNTMLILKHQEGVDQ
jgi:hypothetical protein